MPNTFLTPDIIAREAAMQLSNELVMAGRVFRGLDSEFRQVGDTISVKKPPTFTANDFGVSGQSVQNITDSSVPVKLDKWKDVEVAITSKELTLEIGEFSREVVQPAVAALAQDIDASLLSLYKEVPYFAGAAGTTPDSLEDIANTKKVMRANKCPFNGDVALVMDETAESKFSILDALVSAEKSGTTQTLRSGYLGSVHGLDLLVDQNVASHTAGTGSTAGKAAVDLTAGYTKGATEIHIDGVATALQVGDLITIAGTQYTVTQAGELATADQDITIYPGLAADAANDAEILLVGNHVANLAFHRNAFVLASAPLAPPMGGATYSAQSWNGVTIRVVMDWTNSTRVNTVVFDVLYGVKCIQPELACRLLG